MTLTTTTPRYVTYDRLASVRSLNLFSAQIHWHGIHQHETPYADGFPTQNQCPIPTNNVMQYEWIAEPPGSTFYHAHFHAQTVDGLHGPLIIEDEPGTFPHKYDEELVIILGDEYNRTSWVIENYLETPDPLGIPRVDPFPNNGLMCVYDEKSSPGSATPSCSKSPTGEGFNIDFVPGKVYRLRIICLSLVAGYMFSIDEHKMQVVTADFSVLDGSTTVDAFPIHVSSGCDLRSPQLILSNIDRSTVRCPGHRQARRQAGRFFLDQGYCATPVW